MENYVFECEDLVNAILSFTTSIPHYCAVNKTFNIVSSARLQELEKEISTTYPRFMDMIGEGKEPLALNEYMTEIALSDRWDMFQYIIYLYMQFPSVVGPIMEEAALVAYFNENESMARWIYSLYIERYDVRKSKCPLFHSYAGIETEEEMDAAAKAFTHHEFEPQFASLMTRNLAKYILRNIDTYITSKNRYDIEDTNLMLCIRACDSEQVKRRDPVLQSGLLEPLPWSRSLIDIIIEESDDVEWWMRTIQYPNKRFINFVTKYLHDTNVDIKECSIHQAIFDAL